MKFWLFNHPWEDYKKTAEFIGFDSEKERGLVCAGDKIVYCGNGLVAGIFEAGESIENAFSGWKEPLPFQIRLRRLFVPDVDLVAKPLRYKTQLEKPFSGSGNLYRLSEQEYRKIELVIREKKRELVY